MPTPVGEVALAVKAISDAITGGFKLVAQIMSGAELRRLKYRLEAAENYIFVDEKSGQYKDISEAEQRGKKIHFRKRVFDE